MPKTYDTPWGQRTVTETDEAVTRVVLAMEDDHHQMMADIGYYNKEAIDNYSFRVGLLDVVSMFMDDNDVVDVQMVKEVKKLITEDKKTLMEFQGLEEEITDEAMKQRGKTLNQKKEDAEFLIAIKVGLHRDPVLERVKKNEQILALVGRTHDGTQDNSLDIQKAKLFPITELVHFEKGGFAPCVWHNEKTGSMKYYPKDNHVHCYGCSRSGDAIDVTQAIKECDFNTAVKFLTA